ncbi:neuronal calcium sensor 1 isoform X2 [Lepeophtheirus salmonis]|nr:Kv channel-interacting protein 1-like isoform X2 [Lepeophtheirus salmonis]
MSFGKQEETQQLGNPPSHHIRLHPENQELNEEFGKAVSNLSSEFENELSGEEDEEEDDPSKRQNPLVRLIVKLTKKQSEVKKKDLTLDMFQPSRYKPNDLDQMAEDTKFSKREVRCLYRAFKQECPNGIVDEESFRDIYEKIFPLGDAGQYAHLVFSAIDNERTGGITFGDFMEFLSVICKGTTHDKILWAFKFYDVDKNGFISKDEMVKVSDSIHELMGVNGTTPKSGSKTVKHIEQVFDTMDLNSDGKITIEEFIIYCTSNQEVYESMTFLTKQKVV